MFLFWHFLTLRAMIEYVESKVSKSSNEEKMIRNFIDDYRMSKTNEICSKQ